MPTYSYRCTECGTAFDIQQAFTDDSLTTCPNCSGVLRKVFTAVGVSFSGSGFYQTDSRAAAKASSDKQSADKKKSSSESSSAPAPAAAAPAAAPASAPAPASKPSTT